MEIPHHGQKSKTISKTGNLHRRRYNLGFINQSTLFDFKVFHHFCYMDNLSVTFEFKGKQYYGFFSQASGAGSSAMFHLSVNGFHWGQFFYTENHSWKIYNNAHPELTELSDFFGLVVTAWLDSNG